MAEFIITTYIGLSALTLVSVLLQLLKAYHLIGIQGRHMFYVTLMQSICWVITNFYCGWVLWGE